MTCHLSLLLANNKSIRKGYGEMMGFITSCGRREGSERNNDSQRVATGDLQTKDGVHVSRLPLTLEYSTDLRPSMSEDTITYIK